MYFFRTALVQELGCLTKLCTTHDRVVDQYHALVFDQFTYRDQFHVSNLLSLTLMCRHKGTRPGRGIFDKWAGKRNTGTVGITNGMCGTGVRNTCNDIGRYIVTFCKHITAVVTHLFHVDSFVGRGRITIVDP